MFTAFMYSRQNGLNFGRTGYILVVTYVKRDMRVGRGYVGKEMCNGGWTVWSGGGAAGSGLIADTGGNISLHKEHALINYIKKKRIWITKITAVNHVEQTKMT